MSRNTVQSIPSGFIDSFGKRPPTSSPPRGESFSDPSTLSPDTSAYDTALPPINFQTPIVHRRTGSTLKTVMRKIFTRRRQSQAEGLEDIPDETHYVPPPARPSLPAGERRKPFLAIPSPAQSKQSSPLSAENLHYAESHLSPTAMSYGSLDSPGLPSRQRRATLPSVVFSEDDESRYAVASTAASDPQEERPHMPDQEQQHSLLHARRRSRSAGALRRLAQQHETLPPTWETQSNQLRDSKSPPFGAASSTDQSRRPSTPTVTSITRASADQSPGESDQQAEQLSLPPNVGSLVHTMQRDDSLTVEQRLTTLEVKLIDLEFAIARMQSHPIDTNTGRSSRQKQAAPSESYPPHLRRKASGFSGSGDGDDFPSPLASIPPGRPTSTTTIRPETMQSRMIRPAQSATSLSDLNGVSIEQYSALVTLLRREQTARRNLEGQVAGLRDDVRHLQRTALDSMELGAICPIPIRTIESQELLRFRRALDGSDGSSPITTDKTANGAFETDSDWDRSDINLREDMFSQPKWERQRSITTNMI